MAWEDAQFLELETTEAQDELSISDKYARYVQHCRRHQKSDIITNTAYVNAQFIMAQLLILAREKGCDVRLTTGRLDKNTYNTIAKEFSKLLDVGKKIKILILSADNESLEGNQLFSLVQHHPNGRVLILGEPPESMLHFMLVGDIASNHYKHRHHQGHRFNLQFSL